MIKVECTLWVYEVNGKEIDVSQSRPRVLVRGHNVRNELLVLELPGADSVTVVAKDLLAVNCRRLVVLNDRSIVGCGNLDLCALCVFWHLWEFSILHSFFR